MNQNILKKAIDALVSFLDTGEDKQKISYVIGMLETLYEMGEVKNPYNTPAPFINPPITYTGITTSVPLTEADLMNKEAAEKLKVIKDLGKLE